MSKTTHALTVLAAPELAVEKPNLKKLQAAAVEQCAAVGQMESKAAMGAVLAGITLHRVKASMPHGKFGPWVESNSHSGANLKQRQCNYYMRLAQVFLEKARVQTPDLLALPGDQNALAEGGTAATKRFIAKLGTFVGDLSLTELLIKHGIKGVGLKTALEAAEADTPPAATAEDYFTDVAARLYGFREVATNREALMRLTPQQLDTVREAITDAHAQFTRFYDEARGTKTS